MTDEQPDERLPLADHPLTAPRLEELERLRRQGIEPYPVGFRPDATAAGLHEEHAGLGPGQETGRRVAVAGRLMALRTHGRLAFGEIQDGSGAEGAARIQLFADEERLGEEELGRFLALDLGDWVGARGEVVTTRRGELSVRAEEVMLLAKALRPLPEKWHGLKDVEERYRRRYLDLMVNDEARHAAVVRVRALRALRTAFERRGFLEVETPVLQTQPGGALARPFVTHHDALGIDMYLRIAPELYLKRLVIGGMERVFELGRVFRNEGVSTKYNPEFTMLEAYQAHADYLDMLELTEAVFAETAEAVTGSSRLSYQGRTFDLTPPLRRITYLEAIAKHTGTELDLSMPVEEVRKRAVALGMEVQPGWGPGRIADEVFDRLVQSELDEPTAVLDYPKEISPLARTHRDHPELVERFEIFAGGWELANAFSELNDPLEQRRRFEDQARARAAGDEEAHAVDEDYLLALEYGLPPTGGLGIGVDRLVMLLADRPSIREVILFPHLRPER